MTVPPIANDIADQLIAAIGADDAKKLKALLRAHRLDVHTRIPCYMELHDAYTRPDVTLLHVAVYKHSDNVIKWLIKQGIDIDARAAIEWDDKITALDFVSLMLNRHSKNREIADILLDAKADPNLFLIQSATWDYLKGVKRAVEAGANVNHDSHHNKGWKALHLAALSGNLDMIEYLIARGADVNARNMHFEQKTPLMFAAYHGHTDAMRLLLKHNADPTLLNAKGATLFHEAANAPKNTDEVLDLLLAQTEKPDPALINRPAPVDPQSFWSGKTPLDWAIDRCINYSEDPKKIASFIKHGAQWQQLDAEGRSILHEAISQYSSYDSKNLRINKVIEQLLQAGVDPFLQNKEGITAYHAARNTPGDEVFKNHLKPLHARTRHFNPAADALLDEKGEPTRILQYACYEDLLADTLHPSNWAGHEKALIAAKLALAKALPEPYATRYEALLDVTANRRNMAPAPSSWLKRYADTPPETRARDE